MEYDVLIDDEGNIQFVYADELAAVFEGEELETVRASHVEPHPRGGGWLADMRPIGGPILGEDDCSVDGYAEGELCVTMALLPPFRTRQAALDAERAWLREHKGL